MPSSVTLQELTFKNLFIKKLRTRIVFGNKHQKRIITLDLGSEFLESPCSGHQIVVCFLSHSNLADVQTLEEISEKNLEQSLAICGLNQLQQEIQVPEKQK